MILSKNKVNDDSGESMENSRPLGDWKQIVRNYSNPDPIKSWWQFLSTLALLLFLWWAAYKAIEFSIYLTVAISCLNQFLFIRMFIFLHDCGHGSFFESKKLRTLIGTFCGVLTFTPYKQWSREHAGHHSTSGNLDKRGVGDVWTVTTKEYSEMLPFQKLCYHVFRFPLVNFVIGPFYIFQIRFRFKQRFDGREEDINRYVTNIFIFLVIMALCFAIGWKAFLIVHLPIIILNNILGTWLFFVQHQYRNAYWEKDEKWDYFTAAMKGSTFLKLPKILQWATGNIGIHHVHHLSHKIPNYNLQAAYDENPLFHGCTTIGILKSLEGIWLKLWDENTAELISFGEYYRRYGIKPKFRVMRMYQFFMPWMKASKFTS